MHASFYASNPQFLVAVDCIIFGFQDNKLKLLLQKRNFEPFQGKWSLMGGFVQKFESIDTAAQRVLNELSGMNDIPMYQVGAFGNINRDPGARVISIAYYAMVNADLYPDELISKNFGYWEDFDNLPELHFDHGQMVEKARELLRTEITNKPISFDLLPPHFTLTQLQALYEAVMGCKIDKRNFRKRVAEMDFIQKTDLIDKSGSRRGAHLYKFCEKGYLENPNFKL